jgi:hypothetical protein
LASCACFSTLPNLATYFDEEKLIGLLRYCLDQCLSKKLQPHIDAAFKNQLFRVIKPKLRGRAYACVAFERGSI